MLFLGKARNSRKQWVDMSDYTLTNSSFYTYKASSHRLVNSLGLQFHIPKDKKYYTCIYKGTEDVDVDMAYPIFKVDMIDITDG